MKLFLRVSLVAGNSRWVHAMEWSGQKEFTRAPTVSFTVDGTEAGQLKSHGPLAFLKVLPRSLSNPFLPINLGQ